MKKFLLSAAAVAIMTGAAYAQTGFYVVQDTSTKKCTVVDKRPSTATTVVVDDGKMFKSRTAAETGMKTMKVCAN
jgi:hypothetical protein